MGAGRPVAPFWPALLFQKTREHFFLFHLVGMMKAGQNAYFMNLALHCRDIFLFIFLRRRRSLV